MLKNIIILIIVLLSLNGCATVSTINNAETNSPLFFSGTRLDVHSLLKNKRSLDKFTVKAPKYPLIDLPASFIVDLFISPLTSSVALYKTIFE